MANIPHRPVFNYALPDDFYKSGSSRAGQHRGSNSYDGTIPRSMYINPQDLLVREIPLSPPVDTLDFPTTLYPSGPRYMVEERDPPLPYPVSSQRRRTAPGIFYHGQNISPSYDMPMEMSNRRSSRPNPSSNSSGSNTSSKTNVAILTPPISPQIMTIEPSVPLTVPIPTTGTASGQRYFCTHPDCIDKRTGKSGRSFSRRADVNRHNATTHEGKILFSCPKHNCSRKNENGFSRMDHLLEHRRGYHKEAIPKRHGRSSSSVDATKVRIVTVERPRERKR